MWWGLLWTQQVINSDVNTVTLHNHWYNYIKKANQSWLYSCFPTWTSHWERKTPSGEVEGGVNLFKQQKIWDKEKKSRARSEEARCYMAQLSGEEGGWRGWGVWLVCNQWNVGQLERWWTDEQRVWGLLLLLMLLLLTERWEECQGVKTARRELRHESMKCKNKEGRNGGHRVAMGGGERAAEGRMGLGDFDSLQAPNKKASFSLSSLSWCWGSTPRTGGHACHRR